MLKPVAKSSMYEDIVRQLIGCIKNRVWLPGEFLPTEMELAKTFDVSRNSIREALKSLAYSGIISAKAGHGTSVTPDALQKIENLELVNFISDEASLEDLMETRLIIETELARLAAMRATEEDKAALKRSLENLKGQLIQQEAENIAENPTDRGIDFHMCVASIAKNSVLTKLMQSIQGELRYQRSYVSLQNARSFEVMLRDHEKICDAVLRSDANAAAESMRQHLLNSLGIIQDMRKGEPL